MEVRLSDDYDEKGGMTPSVVSAIVAVTLFVLIILGIVVYMNSDAFGKNGNSHASSAPDTHSVETPEDDISNWVGDSNLRPEDLDFWDKYPAPTQTPVPTAEPIKEENKDPSEDGNHTLITYADGSEEWVKINQSLSKNEYDFTKELEIMERVIETIKAITMANENNTLSIAYQNNNLSLTTNGEIITNICGNVNSDF